MARLRREAAPAEGAVCRALREVREGLVPKPTQDELAARTSISQQMISRYEKSTVPPLAVIWELEAAMGVPHGTVLRRAGWIEDATGVEGAVRTDPRLSPDMREAILAVYRQALRQTSSDGRGRSRD